LDAGSDVNATTNSHHAQTGSSPLMAALPSSYEIHVKKKKKTESLYIIKLLLSHACNINAQNWAGNTALHIAADRSDLQTISLLSENGANLHIRNNFGLTAFEEAIQPNIQRYDVATVLLLHGYDFHIIKPEVHPVISILKGFSTDKSRYFTTSKFTRKTLLGLLLHVVCLNAELEQEICRYLEHYKNIEPHDKYYFEQFLVMKTPSRLQEICRFVIRRAISTNILRGINRLPIAKGLKQFLAFNFDMDRNDPTKCFELTTAILENDEEQVKQLIADGIDLNFSLSHHTPLTEAALLGHSIFCTLLLENGAEVDLYDNTGMTALHIASSNGHQCVVEILLQYGACINKICKFEAENSVTKAAANGHFKTMIYLVENGGNPNVRTSDGRYVIHLAAATGSAEAIKILLARGITAESRDCDLNTPLHLAASRGLLYKNDEINFQDNLIDANFHESIRLLLSAGANRFATNHSNKTPAEVAAIYSDNSLAVLLK
jgi:ankyrin repeat protein